MLYAGMEFAFCVLVAGIILGLIVGFITLCVRFWRVGASVITVVIFLLALIYLPPQAHGEYYGAGNIDLDARIVVENADGSFSTEISFSVEFDGLQYLLPTVVNGKVVSEDEAIKHFLSTGEYLGCFETVEECDHYAEWLHCRQEEFYGAGR